LTPLLRVIGSRTLRRVVTAYALYVITEFAMWIAVLVYAYGNGGVTETGLVSLAQLLPATFAAPFFATLADRRSPRSPDPHLAADLTADIFLAAIDGASGYREDKGAPAAWLHGIARNMLAGEVRRQVSERRATHRIAGRRLLDPDSQARIEERIDAEQQTRALYNAIAQLPGRDRALLELVAVDGLSVSDAAAVLGVKPATARVRLHRARR
jgi:RNA polymerase sigma factor (sigma-70 family)